MTMTFGEMVNMVLDEIDEPQVTEATFDDASNNELRRAKNYVNLTYRNVFNARAEWSWAKIYSSFTATAGQASYTPGSGLDSLANLQKFELVQIDGNPPLEMLSYSEFKRKFGAYEVNETGLPFAAYVLDGALHLFPTPGMSYEVRYICAKRYQKLENFSDTAYIPDEQINVLPAGAIMMAKDHDNEQSMWSGVYQSSLQALRNSEANNHKGYVIIPEDETVTAEAYREILLYE